MSKTLSVTPTANASQGVNINGRIYPYTPPGTILQVPDSDAYVLSANGWVILPDWYQAATANVTATPSFKTAVTATLSTTQNDLTPPQYVGGITNCVIFSPPPGGAIVTGMASAPQDWSVLGVNNSSTDSVTFTHQDSNSQSANQFQCANAGIVSLLPFSCVIMTRKSGFWRFM